VSDDIRILISPLLVSKKPADLGTQTGIRAIKQGFEFDRWRRPK